MIYSQKAKERGTDMEGKDYNFEMAAKPMKESAFRVIVSERLKEIGNGEDEYLCVAYEKEYLCGITALQARRDGDKYSAELVINLHDERPYRIFAMYDLPFYDVEDIFFDICVAEMPPDLAPWREISEELSFLYRVIDDSFDCPGCGKFSFTPDDGLMFCPNCGLFRQKERFGSF